MNEVPAPDPYHLIKALEEIFVETKVIATQSTYESIQVKVSNFSGT
jgi:hypothetical protein